MIMTEFSSKLVEKEPSIKLTKKDITHLAVRTVFLQSSFNYERMQAGGWLYAMLPIFEKICGKDKARLSQIMKDNLGFINTSPPIVGFLMGLIVSLEENNEDRSLINGIKVALFGPLAGIGDAIYWFTILPIVAGICASFANQGSVLGPIIFFLVYCGIFIMRIFWTHLGYETGVKAISGLQESSKTVSKAATVLGVTVIGALIATYVKITVLAKFAIGGGHSIAIQTDFLDKILPNILPLGYTMLMFYLLKKKNINPTLLIVCTFIGAILLSALGVL
jgi:PTS system galactosamine-specific IID component